MLELIAFLLTLEWSGQVVSVSRFPTGNNNNTLYMKVLLRRKRESAQHCEYRLMALPGQT